MSPIMTRTVPLAAAAIALFAVAFAGEDRKEMKRLPLGDKAPRADAMMDSVDGKKYSIDSVAGANGTIVIFSCNHCPWVVKWEDRIASIGNEYKKKGFGVLVINSNDPEASKGDDIDSMKQRAKDRGFEFPYVVDADSSVARAFGASKTPEVFLFDKEKKLAYYGAIDDNADKTKMKEPYLKNALDALAKGEKPATSETKSMGCTIKYRAEAKPAEKTEGAR